jgi:hypothetical protein
VLTQVLGLSANAWRVIMERDNEKQPDFKIYLTRRTLDPATEPAIPPSTKLEHYIVQFNKPLTGKERQLLRTKYKLALDHYVPNFAFLERLDSDTLAALSENSLHRASVLFQPNDKISPAINKHTFNEQDGLLIRVLLFPSVSEEDISVVVTAIENLLEEVAPTDEYCSHEETQPLHTNDADEPNKISIFDDRKLGGDVHLVLVLPSLDLLPLIAKLDQVQWIEEVVESTPDCPATITNLDTNTVSGTIQAGDPTQTPLWDNGIYGTGQRIGIIDHDSVDLTHCMFQDQPGIAIGAQHRKVVGFRLFGSLSNSSAHGTAVASIAAGDKIYYRGADANRGIAWDAKISYDEKVLRNYRPFRRLLDNQFNDQVFTHSNSWHDQTIEYNKVARDVDCFVRANEEHFVCGAAGNSGFSGFSEVLGPPGTAKNALCVAASLPYPDHLQHGDGLQGPTRDNRYKPEICAPGGGIQAAQANSDCSYRHISTPASSFATPVIAGAAALVRQYYLEGFYPAGYRDNATSLTPSGALIKASLLNSTVPMEDVTNYPNNRTGWGLVQLDNTLFFAGGPRKLFVADVRNSDGLLSEESHSYQITVDSNSQSLKITLAWTDLPADLYAAGKALVNNLDLVVTSPDGYSTYLGNVYFDRGFSLPVSPDTPGDDINNVEMVIIEYPAPGDWTITVKGANVSLERQGYAVVASGSLA